MIPLLLPGQRISVDGQQVGRVVTVIPHPCRPLRPFIPAVWALDFDVVGVERRTSNNADEVRKLWPDEVFIPAASFVESFDSLFKLDLPSFLRGDELILVVQNLNRGPRQFVCSWLVEDERRS